MRLHIITIGQPKLAYAKLGWDEYWQRLKHYHQLRVTHISDKQNNPSSLLAAIDRSYSVALSLNGKQFTSPELSNKLENWAQMTKEVSFIVGGPSGLPQPVIESSIELWCLSLLTFPHDLAMVILLESLYRASSIAAHQSYHK